MDEGIRLEEGMNGTYWGCPETGCPLDPSHGDYFNNGTGYDGRNTTGTEWEKWSSIILMAVTSTILGLMILATIIGNVFVIAAVFFEKNLQNVANYLIVSLAVADLMVACLVMPLGAVYEISGNWILGQLLCDMWTSSDVLCCTASILHLVAIAVDRYWAVTNIEYIRARNRGRIITMIFLIWFVAAIVSLAPFLGWKDPDDEARVEISKKCLVSQDMGYQIFATCATFYVPLCIILLLYWKIWKTARRRIRHRPGRIQEPKDKKSKNCMEHSRTMTTMSDLPQCSRETTEFSIHPSPSNLTPTTPTPIISNPLVPITTITGPPPSSSSPPSQHVNVEINTISQLVDNSASAKSGGVDVDVDVDVDVEVTIDPVAEDSNSKTSNGYEEQPLSTLSPSAGGANLNGSRALGSTTPLSASPISTSHHHKGHSNSNSAPNSTMSLKTTVSKKKESIEAKRERKAAKTLAIITGAFVMCWLPFFVIALTMAICSDHCWLPDSVFSAFLWLGYFNSTLNPIIYTLFSPEFRMAFKRILCGNRGRGRK